MVASIMLAALGAPELSAQSVELILRNREELELTEAQVQQLDAIRREIVQERNAAMAEMAELRSQLAAGLIRESQVLAAREQREEGAQARAEQRRARIDAILTDTQREELLTLRRQGVRARFAPGRQGPGFGPWRPGFAPGRGFPGRAPGFGGPRRGFGGFGLR